MKKYRFFPICLSLSLVLLAAACAGGNKAAYEGGSSTAQSTPAAMPAPAAAPAPESATMAGGGYGVSYDGSYEISYDVAGEAAIEAEEQKSGRTAEAIENKIIFTGHIFTETTEFNATLDSIDAAVRGVGGYKASSNLYNYKRLQNRDFRCYEVSLKVPVEAYQQTFAYLKTLGKVSNSSESAQDVTAEYYDLESRLKTKRVEEERVLEMITRAEAIEDLLVLEERLGQIRTDIEVFETQLRDLSRLTSYSTIEMVVYEIDEGGILAVSEDFGVRLRRSFASSISGTLAFMENCLLFLAGVVIPALLLGLLGLVVWAVWKLSGRKKD